MRFSQRNKKRFELFHARYDEDPCGDGRNVYDMSPAASFLGSLQPVGERSETEACGIKRGYTHFVYVSEDKGFIETDRITDGARWYEIKTIKRWSSYLRLLAEEVSTDG